MNILPLSATGLSEGREILDGLIDLYAMLELFMISLRAAAHR
jgi:hypothetical protein